LWGGRVNGRRGGYGRFYLAGRTQQAHRVAYLFANGRLPKCVLHKCDNPQCVRPGHLEAGTQADNVRQMHERGRWRAGDRRGERNANARLSPTDVLQIRRSNLSASAAAQKYGVTREYIWQLRKKRKWAHL
jgi:hypothetical protein